MKKVWALTALIGILVTAGLRAEEQQEAKQDKGGLPPKQISQEMAEVWCSKMDECAKDKSMSIRECQKILFTSFKKGFDKLPKTQPLQLERDTLDQCKENIGKGSCDSLKGARSLPGCEFISRLGQ